MTTWQKMVVGVVSSAGIAVLGVLAWLRLGFFPVQADVPPSAWEVRLATMTRNAAVRRHSPAAAPVRCTDVDLATGLKVYKQNCAGCHGMAQGSNNDFASALYPPAPQFGRVRLSWSEGEVFYIIWHGVRMTGMPSYSTLMEEQDAWCVARFLKHLDGLPPTVDAGWRAEP